MSDAHTAAYIVLKFRVKNVLKVIYSYFILKLKQYIMCNCLQKNLLFIAKGKTQSIKIQNSICLQFLLFKFEGIFASDIKEYRI